MKKTIVTLALAGLLASLSLAAIAQEDKKAAEARKDIKEAKKDLKEAKIDSAADFQKFKKDAEEKIAANHKKIAELKAKKSNDTKEVRKKYDTKVEALEVKNNELKKKIKYSDGTKTSMWTDFKIAFTKDMRELEAAIKRI